MATDKQTHHIIVTQLTNEEKILDEIIKKARKEFIATKGNKIDYTMPVMEDKEIWDSKLYKLVKTMPKGGDLHTHGATFLPVKELIEFLKDRQDVVVCVSGDKRHGIYFVNDKKRPKNCMNLGKALKTGALTEEQLLKEWCVLGKEKYENVWSYFETLFEKDYALKEDYTLMHDYYVATFNYYCDQNIYNLEIRVPLFGTHEDAVKKTEAIRAAYYNVRKNHPEFRMRLIGAGLKRNNIKESVVTMLMDNSIYVAGVVKDEFDKNNVTDFLVGIDLINEEDDSRQLSFYENMLANIKAKNPNLSLLLHAGESLLPENKAVETAKKLNAKRIGHGVNLYKFPDVMQWCKENKVCVEVCPISNSKLGFCADVRNHPALGYIKQGIPVVLSSDDPSYLEHTILTDDYFAAIVCWGLELKEIKQICINSITYSATNQKTKDEMMNFWSQHWDAWVKSSIKQH